MHAPRAIRSARNYRDFAHVFIANAGQDDEFEVTCKVSFRVTPREAQTSTYPGAEPAIEDIAVELVGDYCFGYPPALAALREQIEDELTDDPAPLWDFVAGRDERDSY